MIYARGLLHPATYQNALRVRLSSLKNLPNDWKLSQPNRTSAWFDALMSRWLDDEVVASSGASNWKMRFRGQTVLFFGEATTQSGKYRVLIDGQPVAKSDLPDGVFNANAGGANGNTHHTRIIATDLDANIEHTLEIVLMLEAGQELRLESVCIASEKQPFIATQ